MLRRIWNLIGGSKTAGLAATAEARDAPPPRPFGRHVVTRPIPKNKLDFDAVKIIQRLTRHEHEAYLVGGCVRDLLLDREPKDYDVGTSATPRQIKRLFRNCRIIGRRFRLAHIYFRGGKLIEVATFRASDRDDDDSATQNDSDEDLMIRDDNRFGTVEQDALRRDFTINQLFYDVNEQKVIDHTDGLGDLGRRLIRTIGDPEIRFREDPIRILRAIKFAARLDFDIETKTKAALFATRNEIPKAAPPRVLEELNRFCRGGAGARSFELLRETRVFEAILPEWNSGLRPDRAWRRLQGMLRALDEQTAAGVEVQTGSILAAMVLPQIWKDLGWGDDGSADPSRGVKLRELVDNRLRDVSLRLRVSRKESERCRQLIGTLQRMIPDDRIRPRTRASIRRRASLDETLVLLRALAESEGGQFAEAAQAWSGTKQSAATGAGRGSRSRDGDTDATEAGGEQRSRRRRGRRGRGRGAAGTQDRPADSDKSAASERKTDDAPKQRSRKSSSRSRQGSKPQNSERAPKKPMPDRWDDDYFFSALPSVPKKLAGESGDSGDRYGADTLNRGEPGESPANKAKPSDD